MGRRLVAILVANVVGYRRAIELIEALELRWHGYRSRLPLILVVKTWKLTE